MSTTLDFETRYDTLGFQEHLPQRKESLRSDKDTAKFLAVAGQIARLPLKEERLPGAARSKFAYPINSNKSSAPRNR